MFTQILTTKFHIPPARPELISRSRLLERLNEGLHRKLILISAPAGFGKTTLVSDWLRQLDLPSTWLSLDEADNDPTRFLVYFIAALQQIEPEIGQTAQNLLQSPQLPPAELLMTTLINDIAGTSDFILILDDYHLIDAGPIQDALTFLLDHLPPQMHLVMTTRAGPRLPLSRLRGRGQLTELRVDDLRFTAQETSSFLKQMTGLTMSEKDVTALETRTEGWITGLQLASHFMQGQDAERTSDFIATFTGDNRYLVDYLVEEVLSRQTQDTQTFLLQTSILGQMTGPLCNAVTDLNNSQDILESLEQANLFIVPLDNERQWYRYQQFFTEFLQGRLRRSQPELVSGLHVRAASWYQTRALYEQAVDHFLATDQIEQTVDLVEEAINSTLYERGEVTTFLNWLDALPEDILLTRPRLCLAQVWAFFFAGQWHKVEPRLQDVERILATEMDNDGLTSLQPVDLPTHIQEMQGEVFALRSELALFQKDFLRALELSEQALAYLPHDSLHARGTATQIQGYTYRLNGDVDKAQQALVEASSLSRKVGNINTGIFALSDLAEVQVMQGHLHQAAETYQQVMDLANEHHAWPFPPTGIAYVGMGNLLREWNDLETAAQHLLKGIELISPAGHDSVISQAYSILAYVRQSQGKSDEATEFLQQAEDLAQKSGAHPIRSRFPMMKTRLWLMQGKLEEAAQWAARYQAQKKQGEIKLAYQHQFAEITLARVRLAQSRPDLDLLNQLLQTAQTAGWQNNVIELLILQAVSFSSQGDNGQAVITLEKALTLAEPEGYVRLFIDEGVPMADLLRSVIKQSIYPAYVGKLQASFMPSVNKGKISSQALIDPLTNRELEVLKLMATGLSNREIAAELVVALGTVAKYSNNIFTKLNVRNRTEAISRAGALDLL